MRNPLAGRLRPEYLVRPAQVARRLRRGLSRAPASASVRLPWGVALEIDPRNDAGVSAAVWRSGVHDLALSEALWRLVPAGALAVDVGANIGYCTGIMALRAGPAGRVVAFEPLPSTVERLRRNVAALGAAAVGAAPVSVRPLALSARRKTGFLEAGFETLRNPGVARLCAEGPGAVPVECSTLDEEFPGRERIAVLKIDVERHEGAVLAGARNLLAARRVDTIAFEAFPGALPELTRLLETHGYTVLALGRSFSGPALTAGAELPPRLGFEPPNYLAVLDPAATRAAMAPRGWRCLRPGRGGPEGLNA